jgi:hypothetical protein
MLALVSALTGCADWSGAGALRLDPLPASVEEPCPHPSDLLSRGGTVADDEISLGRVGDALIQCGQEKAVAVEAYNGVRGSLAQ